MRDLLIFRFTGKDKGVRLSGTRARVARAGWPCKRTGVTPVPWLGAHGVIWICGADADFMVRENDICIGQLMCGACDLAE